MVRLTGNPDLDDRCDVKSLGVFKSKFGGINGVDKFDFFQTEDSFFFQIFLCSKNFKGFLPFTIGQANPLSPNQDFFYI